MKMIKNPGASAENEVEFFQKFRIMNTSSNIMICSNHFKYANNGDLCIVMEYKCSKGTLANQIRVQVLI